MAAPERPPKETTVADLFERWLPAAYAASGRRAPADAPLVRATISGAAGGAWDLRAEEEGLAVAPAGKSPPDVWLRQTQADFLAAFAGDPDLPDLLPPQMGPLDLLFLDPADV